MKTTINSSDKKMTRAIEMILDDGGFVTERDSVISQKGYTIHRFTIQYSTTQELAELFIDVGKSMIKDFHPEDV